MLQSTACSDRPPMNASGNRNSSPCLLGCLCSRNVARDNPTTLFRKEALQKLIEEKREEAAQKALLRSAVQRGSDDVEENTSTKLKVVELDLCFVICAL